ncbi:MAG: M3 family metallopeptidase [Pseudomonadota bacterium]|nr:M3 family metallopeptidase [Pseudomonadota bacterium]
MARHRSEIAAILASSETPTFENTIAALEAAGRDLAETARLFGVVAGTSTTKDIQALEREIMPELSRHGSAIALNPQLFARVQAVYDGEMASPALSREDRRLLERTYRGLLRSGAQLSEADRTRFADIGAELSELGTGFSQNILADEADWSLDLGPDDLGGLPGWLVSSLAAAAQDRGKSGHVLTLSRSLVVPFLTYSDRADLREKAFEAWTKRGENDGPSDNRAIMAKILKLRQEKAALLGFASYAAHKLDDQMAKEPKNVRDLLMRVWEPARERAKADAAALADLAREAGQNADILASDWRYYAQKRRLRDLDVDESALKPYFALERMIEAAFDVAGRLFGLSFKEVSGVAAWHPDVRCFEVYDRDGALKGIFLGDYFARSSKRSGAWMSALRSQHKMGEGQSPIIYNVCNFSKPPAGTPALLSLDDARTLFHEFGHALHGLLSNVTWPSLSGTAVARDFVELPSQLYEHWLMVPEILERHARHVETGDPLPKALVDKVIAAQRIDAGFDTVEYTASAIVDLDLHERTVIEPKPLETERETLERIGMPDAIVMRHRSPHFAHIFSGEGYSAGYYSYMWSEVLDADAFEAFREAGDPFEPAIAAKLHDHIYSAGDSEDPAVLYERFRGRAPNPEALMRKRGFAAG